MAEEVLEIVTPRSNGTLKVQSVVGGASRTKQADRKAADINEIMRKFNERGILPTLPDRSPIFGDFSSGEDFHQKMIRITSAREQFEALPSKVRARFANDPAQLVDFLRDSKNDEEALKLGLKKKGALPPRKDDQGRDVPREETPAAPPVTPPVR